MVKIYLDAGHGGKDSGAVGNGLYEKDIVLDISGRIETKLKEYKNVEVMQTRTTDVFLELAERTAKANQWGADAFVSIHCNANPSTAAKGFETYVYNGDIGNDTIAFHNVMHQEIVKMIAPFGIVDRGKKAANFHVLRESTMIALLGENLFVSNAADAALLKNNSFLDAVAQGHVTGLEKFFGLERTARPPTTGELYQVIAGTYSNYDNAVAQAKKLITDGYSAYIQKK